MQFVYNYLFLLEFSSVYLDMARAVNIFDSPIYNDIRTENPRVGGSIPPLGTMFLRPLAVGVFLSFCRDYLLDRPLSAGQVAAAFSKAIRRTRAIFAPVRRFWFRRYVVSLGRRNGTAASRI